VETSHVVGALGDGFFWFVIFADFRILGFATTNLPDILSSYCYFDLFFAMISSNVGKIPDRPILKRLILGSSPPNMLS
jgi:hypothetical protein